MRDKNYYNLNGTVDVVVGIIVDDAYKSENSVITDIESVINQSDNVTTSITIFNAIEDFMNLQFLNSVELNRVLSNLTFYVEHNESQTFDLILEWYNVSSALWQDVCRIPTTPQDVEEFGSCDLLPLIERAPRLSNLTLKITDNQTDFGVGNQPWTYIDYTYVVAWTDPDTTSPSVDIITPFPNQVFNSTKPIPIRINVTENVMVDTLYAEVIWSLGSVNLTFFPVNVNYFGEGIYEANFTDTIDLDFYNVTVYVNDTVGNINNTEKTNFTIQAPDLTSNVTYIDFSKIEPIEGENISINLTIFNIGNNNATNFIVRFYDGNYTNGIQINGDILVERLDYGKNITVNVSWIAVIGTHNIQATIDSPVATNGTVFELNETNNIVNRIITIPSYHIYYGNASGLIRLDTENNESKFSWDPDAGGNIYVVETGSSIGFESLQALGRNTINVTAINDFFEADVELLLENYTDSINNTYTFQNAVIFEKNITIYDKLIKDIPHINSTNTSNFQTGILWDMSDGGAEYDGTQDIVFVTEINNAKQGKAGIVDYEVRIPATLDTYKLGAGTVTFYTEIN
ncbi:MAG: hypothetical protein OEY79_05150 [Anaplasmataceae bacterium]|nr:hypothetical protein [Anaplasmataceae bacterium]